MIRDCQICDSRWPNMFINAIDKIRIREADEATNVVVKTGIEIIADPVTVEGPGTAPEVSDTGDGND